MSLFDGFSNVRTKKTSSLSPAEAFAGILLVAVAADGYLADEEMILLVSTMKRMELFQSYPEEHVSRMLGKLMRIIKLKGCDTLLGVSVESLPDYLHETVFAVSTDIVLSDGEVSDEEEYLLDLLHN